jgi:hypothetical protein
MPDAGPWRVHVPVSFLDARSTHRRPDGSPISVRERLMLLSLDGICRTKPYCWISNDVLAEAYGCQERGLIDILEEMERDRLIERVRTKAGKKVRFGIVLLKRADPGQPVANTREAKTAAIEALMKQRDRLQKNAVSR